MTAWERFETACARFEAMHGEPGVFAAGLLMALRYLAERHPDLVEVAAAEAEAWVDALCNPDPLPKARRATAWRSAGEVRA